MRNQYLGGSLGMSDFFKLCMREKLEQWKTSLKAFILVAQWVPHEAYTATTKSLKHCWTFTLQALQVDLNKVKEIDDVIAGPLLDALLQKQANNTTHKLCNIQVENGGLGLPNTSLQKQLHNTL